MALLATKPLVHPAGFTTMKTCFQHLRLFSLQCLWRGRRCESAHRATQDDYRFRYLKNIMGLWMIQSVKGDSPELGFGEISELASKQTIPSFVDANDPRFLAPEHMTSEVQKACKESGQQVPQGIAEVACVIYNSLAKCYADTAKEIEKPTGKTYDCIQIVGGGANADYLNKLTAFFTKKTIYAGPTEATAIGNLCAQMIAAGELEKLKGGKTMCLCFLPNS